MIKGFWDTIDKPIIGLAPMDGVTDAAFRYIVAKYGSPSLTMTEFTSVEGIRAGATRLLDDFLFHEIERPVVAQVFGADPQAFYGAALIISALGFDGIDINMGCPAKNVTSHGAGAALILDPERAKEIIRQTRSGTKAWADGITLKDLNIPEDLLKLVESRAKNHLGARTQLPVSVKTRIGYSEITIKDWVQHLLEETPVAITIHGRTLKQLYSGAADWEAIGEGAKILKDTETLCLGNGDIISMEDAHNRIKHYNLDGALIGRATFGNPWFFTNHSASLDERKSVALEHAEYFNSVFSPRAFMRMRKHLLDYLKGFEGAKELRKELMRVASFEEVQTILSNKST